MKVIIALSLSCLAVLVFLAPGNAHAIPLMPPIEVTEISCATAQQLFDDDLTCNYAGTFKFQFGTDDVMTCGDSGLSYLYASECSFTPEP